MAARSPHAFAVHALLRFNGVEYTVTANRSVSASMTPSHVLPVLALGSEEGENEEWDDVLLAGFPAIAKALVEKGWSLDAKLTKTQLAECLAFATTMDAILERARLFEWFLIEENFEVVHKVLAQDLSFPLSWIVPAMQRREARDRLRHMVVDEAGLWFDVRECLHALSVRLGDRKAFFYGDSPSSLDALLFGFLAIIIHTPVPHAQTRAILAEFPNLVQFCNRIQQQYFVDAGLGDFSSSSFNNHAPRAGNRSATSQRDRKKLLTPEEEARRQRNKLFVALTVGSFIGYALFGSELEFEGISLDVE